MAIPYKYFQGSELNFNLVAVNCTFINQRENLRLKMRLRIFLDYTTNNPSLDEFT